MFYRVYSPVAFPQKWDKDGAFVRHYVPELKDYPSKYIYEPWKAPIADQKKAGTRIADRDDLDTRKVSQLDKGFYPKPIFDFASRRKICLDGMKEAYKINLYGNDARVLDGSWPTLFPDESEGPTNGRTTDSAVNQSNKKEQLVKRGKTQVRHGRGVEVKDEDEGAAADEGAEVEADAESGIEEEDNTSTKQQTTLGKRKTSGTGKNQASLDGHVERKRKKNGSGSGPTQAKTKSRRNAK